MQFCLSHPTEGYYSQGDVFGRKGDFVTSPEISQVFGEVRVRDFISLMAARRHLATHTVDGSRQPKEESPGGARSRTRNADG